MNRFFLLFIASSFMLLQVAAQPKPNILFISIDDLKPILGCYGNTLIHTPNIDRLAARGTVFMNNHCQQAVCGPSRASLMTGKRPDHTGVWDLQTKMRDVHPDILTLPQYLMSQGYTTQGIGKIYDYRCVDQAMDAPSWSAPYHRTATRYFAAETGRPLFYNYQSKQLRQQAVQLTEAAKAKGLSGNELNNYVQNGVKPSTENEDLPDNAYTDGANALQAQDILINLSKQSQPFFLAVGFNKPHLPFVAPQKYWDLYHPDSLPLADYAQPTANPVSLAYHNADELRAYSDIPPILSSGNKLPGLKLPASKQRELIHGYYAAVSYADAQVGKLLSTLDSLGLRSNTIVVLWGDHGFHLGDHNLWCKHSNFEQATRSPLMIAAPGIAASVVQSPTEFVDVFPTLCALADVAIPANLDGLSLLPAMQNTATPVKPFAVSQYPRFGGKTKHAGSTPGKCMGYSIRTHRYRYTLWMGNDFKSTQPYDPMLLIDSELYDYEKDPDETTNFINQAGYKKVQENLHRQMLAFFGEQYSGK